MGAEQNLSKTKRSEKLCAKKIKK